MSAPTSSEQLILIEVDAQGRRRRHEVFASDRLGDAVVRLYERYAELLPDGPERARAAATARSVAAMLGPFDLDRCATVLAPAVEAVDHRILGTWSARGAEALLRALPLRGSSSPMTSPRASTTSSACSADALLVRGRTPAPTAPAAGAYERQFLLLCVFGSRWSVARAAKYSTPTATPRRSPASTP